MTPNMVPCPYCEDSEAGRGWIVINPDWPNGELHYREHCPHCYGEGKIRAECLTPEDTMGALLDLLEVLS